MGLGALEEGSVFPGFLGEGNGRRSQVSVLVGGGEEWGEERTGLSVMVGGGIKGSLRVGRWGNINPLVVG
ncbi:unnamed protein product, partial [Ilex paraguariensis]